MSRRAGKWTRTLAELAERAHPDDRAALEEDLRTHGFAIVGPDGRRTEIVRADHLGPCDTCGTVVRPVEECSECLEEAGIVRHDRCCDLPFGGLL